RVRARRRHPQDGPRAGESFRSIRLAKDPDQCGNRGQEPLQRTGVLRLRQPKANWRAGDVSPLILLFVNQKSWTFCSFACINPSVRASTRAKRATATITSDTATAALSRPSWAS